jgi:hypothetical protein
VLPASAWNVSGWPKARQPIWFRSASPLPRYTATCDEIPADEDPVYEPLADAVNAYHTVPVDCPYPHAGTGSPASTLAPVASTELENGSEPTTAALANSSFASGGTSLTLTWSVPRPP